MDGKKEIYRDVRVFFTEPFNGSRRGVSKPSLHQLGDGEGLYVSSLIRVRSEAPAQVDIGDISIFSGNVGNGFWKPPLSEVQSN